MVAIDLTYVRKPIKTHTLAFALGPIHVPKVYPDPIATLNEANKNSALITFRPVIRMGPPMRAMTVGDSLKWYGGNSFVRGGAAATGHTWKVYEFNSSLTDEDYLADRGAEVTTGKTLLDSGQTIQWAPTAPGTFSIELHLSGATEGDGVTAPLGFGVRFVKVFAAGGHDLQGVPELNGPDGDLDGGGVTASMVYPRPDNLGGRQIINPSARIVVNARRFYGDNVSELTEYNWKPSSTLPADRYANEIVISGLIQDTSIREDPLTHAVSFTVEGAQTVLQTLQMPSRTLGMTGEGDPRPVRATPTFYDEDLWQALLTAHATYFADEPFEGPGWVYRVAGLLASDPILAILGFHTSALDYFDLGLDQSATDVVPSVEGQLGSVEDYIRAIQAGRFGRLMTDAASIIYAGPDDDLRQAVGRPDPVINLDGTLYKSIRVTRARSRVGQVFVQSHDTIAPSPETILVGPNTDEAQRFTPKQYESVYPAIPEGGGRKDFKAARFFDQDALDDLAPLLHAKENCEFPEIEIEIIGLGQLDLGQPLTIEVDPHSEEAALEWNVAAGGEPLRAYITRYRNRIAVPDGEWATTYRCRKSTGL